MQDQSRPRKTRKPGRLPLMGCFALFAIYFVNMFVGKANILYHLGLPHMDNVGEFLLMAAASTLLIVAALEREAAETKDNEKPTEVKE